MTIALGGQEIIEISWGTPHEMGSAVSPIELLGGQECLMSAADCSLTRLKRVAICPNALRCQEAGRHRKTETVFSTSTEGGRGKFYIRNCRSDAKVSSSPGGPEENWIAGGAGSANKLVINAQMLFNGLYLIFQDFTSQFHILTNYDQIISIQLWVDSVCQIHVLQCFAMCQLVWVSTNEGEGGQSFYGQCP